MVWGGDGKVVTTRIARQSSPDGEFGSGAAGVRCLHIRVLSLSGSNRNRSCWGVREVGYRG